MSTNLLAEIGSDRHGYLFSFEFWCGGGGRCFFFVILTDDLRTSVSIWHLSLTVPRGYIHIYIYVCVYFFITFTIRSSFYDVFRYNTNKSWLLWNFPTAENIGYPKKNKNDFFLIGTNLKPKVFFAIKLLLYTYQRSNNICFTFIYIQFFKYCDAHNWIY